MSVILPAPVSELDLHAWADGALSPDRARLVEDWLRAHPDSADEVRHWRLQADALRMLYPLPEAETMSPALRRSLERAGTAREAAASPAPQSVPESTIQSTVRSPAQPHPQAQPTAEPARRRYAGIAAAVAVALALGVAVATHGDTGPASLADRALVLHEGFRAAAAEPGSPGLASLAGIGSAGPDLGSAGYGLRAVRTVPDGAAGYFYEGPGHARLTLVVGRRQPGQPDEFSFVQRGETALFGWQDQRAAFVLVGSAPGSALLPVARLVHAGLTRQNPDSQGLTGDGAGPGDPPRVRPAAHHRM